MSTWLVLFFSAALGSNLPNSVSIDCAFGINCIE